MKYLYKYILILITFASAWISLYGQDAIREKEPPIPVYIVPAKPSSPFIQYDSILASHDSQFVLLARKHKEMQISVAQSLSQMDAQFLLLYVFIALLAVTLILMFVVYTRLKKEFSALQEKQKEILKPADTLPPEDEHQAEPIPQNTEVEPAPRRKRVLPKKPVRRKKI
jgi:hypothetical protein